MKAKCEEIVIEQYLKGNISNEFKDELLWGINARCDNEECLKILFGLLKDNKKETFNIFATFFQVARKQINAEADEEFIGMLIKELEDEPTE